MQLKFNGVVCAEVYRMFTVIYFIYLLNNFSHMLLTMNAICVVLCIATECRNSLPRLISCRVSIAVFHSFLFYHSPL